uniref:Sgnh hydrolase n=3 Tax=Tetraselmis sp. GSL018 TaxID=582737 RepID=A0A061QZF3_9CHLO
MEFKIWSTNGIQGRSFRIFNWRLGSGESPACPGSRVVVVLIGTNDLGLAALEAGSEDPSKAVQAATAKASKGVQEVIKTFRFLLPDSHIILLGILPRGFKDKSDPDKPVIHYNQPSIFTDPIKQINRELGAFALSQRGVHFLDCGRHFVGADGHLVPGLMPDALHPNAAGMAKLADCVNTVLMPLLANRSIGSAA